MSELRSGGREDRQGVVGAPPKRDPVANQARRSAASAASEAQAAADDALLAQVTADDAMFEAEFGSVAVGRLAAGTLSVGVYIESQGFVSGSSGFRINADGSAEFNDANFRGTITAGANDELTIHPTDGITLQLGTTRASSVMWEDDAGQFVEMYGYRSAPDNIMLFNGADKYWFVGGEIEASAIQVGSTPVALEGTYTADGISWLGAAFGTNGETSSTGGHVHSVPYHTHTVTI